MEDWKYKSAPLSDHKPVIMYNSAKLGLDINGNPKIFYTPSNVLDIEWFCVDFTNI